MVEFPNQFAESLGSDVPLTEDILKKNLNFVKSWAEWSAENRIQVKQDGAVTGGGGTFVLFTVPAKNTLYIVSASVTSIVTSSSPGAAGGCSLRTNQNTASQDICQVRTSGDADGMVATSDMVYPMPIKVEEGQSVNLITIGALSTASSGNFTGWLEPKRLN